MNNRDAFGFLKSYYARMSADDAMGLAAQLAYYFLLSLFPFLIFAITLLGYTPITPEDILGLAARYVPAQTLTLIESNLETVLESRNSGLLSFGIIATIWSASNALSAIMKALNRAYEIQQNRPYLKARALAVLLTFMMIPVIVVSLLLPVFGKRIGLLMFSFLGLSSTFLLVWNLVRWVLSSVVMITAFSLIYYFAPNMRPRFKDIIVGALFTTLGWQLVSLGFSYYVENFGNFSATYGSLGGIIILMMWFYLTALIIILGGELNATIDSFRSRGTD